MEKNPQTTRIPEVVIVGGGFGGLNAARRLAKAPVHITMLDRNNYHLFQPLLYQVATAGVAPTDVAYPLRTIFRKQKNFEFRWPTDRHRFGEPRLETAAGLCCTLTDPGGRRQPNTFGIESVGANSLR